MAAVPEPGRQNDGGGTSAGGDRCEPREQRDGSGLESKSGSCMPPRSNFKGESCTSHLSVEPLISFQKKEPFISMTELAAKPVRLRTSQR